MASWPTYPTPREPLLTVPNSQVIVPLKEATVILGDASFSATSSVVSSGEIRTYEVEVLSDNPFLYWRLGESSGPTAEDRSPNNRDGTYSGTGITYDQANDAMYAQDDDGSAVLDGASGRITSTHDPFLSGSFTLEIIASLDQLTGANQCLVGADGAVQWIVTPSGFFSFFYSGLSSVGWVYPAASPGNISTAKHHFVLTFDPTGNAELWIDGVSQGTQTAGAVGATALNVQVGARLSGGSGWWDGSVDEFAVYSGILSSGRIQAHYSTGLKAQCASWVSATSAISTSGQIIVTHTRSALVNANANVASIAIEVIAESSAFNASAQITNAAIRRDLLRSSVISSTASIASSGVRFGPTHERSTSLSASSLVTGYALYYLPSFPVVVDYQESSLNSNSDLIFTWPSDIAKGDLFIAIGAGRSSITTWQIYGTGFTLLGHTGSTQRLGIFYRWADGTEPPSTTFTSDQNQNRPQTVRIYRIRGADKRSNPEMSAFATGTSVNPNPASLNPTGWDIEKTLWIAAHANNASALTQSAIPTNYGNGVYLGVGPGLGTATRNLEAASDDPGTFTISASNAWVAATVAIKPKYPISIERSSVVSGTGSISSRGQTQILLGSVSVNAVSTITTDRIFGSLPILDGIEAWLDATKITGKANNDPLPVWANESTDPDTTDGLLLSEGAPIYKTNQLNGKPGVDFTFGTTGLTISGLRNNSVNRTFYVVCESNPFAGETQWVFWWNSYDGLILTDVNPNQWNVYYSPVTFVQVNIGNNTGPSLFTITLESLSSGHAYKDGSSGVPFEPPDDWWGNNKNYLAIGEGYFDGNLYELLVYDTAHSTIERESIENHLISKWAIKRLKESGPAQVSASTSISSSGVRLAVEHERSSSISASSNIVSHGIPFLPAFPVIQSYTESSTNSSLDLYFAFPSGIQKGELLLVVGAGRSSVTTWIIKDGDTGQDMGFTLLAHYPGAGSSTRLAVWYKNAVGTESGMNILPDQTTSRPSTVRVFRITGAHGVTAPAISASAAGTSVSPNPASLNPANWDIEKTLWIAAFANNASALTQSAVPTNYTNGVYLATGPGLGTAQRNLEAASDDPAAFTISSSNAWTAATIAIRPKSPVSVERSSTVSGTGSIGSYGQTQNVERSASISAVAGSSSVGIVGFLPVIQGIDVWLDATRITGVANGAALPIWQDQGTKNNDGDAEFTDGVYQTNVLNGKPGVDFNYGAAYYMAGILSDDPTRTYFVVCEADLVDGFASAFYHLGGGGAAISFWDNATPLPGWVSDMYDEFLGGETGPSVFALTIDGINVNEFGEGEGHVYKDGAASVPIVIDQDWFNAGGPTDRMSLGADGNFSGKMYEFIVYDSILSTTDREAVENYLMTKWGIPPIVEGTTAAFSVSSSIATVGEKESPFTEHERSVSVSTSATIVSAPQRVLQRSTSFSTSANILTQGKELLERSASFSATSAIASAPQRVRIRSAALSANATVISKAIEVIAESSAFNATAQITTAGQRVRIRSVLINPTASIVSTSIFWTTFERTTAINATATIASVPQRVRIRSTAFSATASIATVAIFFTVFQRTTALNATSLIASIPRKESLRSTSFTASALILTQGKELLPRSVAFTSTASIASIPRKELMRSSLVSATASIATVSIKVRLRSAALSATSLIATKPQRELRRSTSFSSTASINAVGEEQGLWSREVIIGSIASIASAQIRAVQRASVVNASGAIQSAQRRDLQRSTLFTSSANILTQGKELLERSSTLSATASVTNTDTDKELQRSNVISATASISSVPQTEGIFVASASLSSASTVIVTDIERELLRSASLSATASSAVNYLFFTTFERVTFLAGSGSVEVDSEHDSHRASSLSALTSITSTGLEVLDRSTSVDAIASIASHGESGAIFEASAEVSSVSDIVVSSYVEKDRLVLVEAASDIQTDSEKELFASSSLDSIASIESQGGKVIDGASSLSASSFINGAGERVVRGITLFFADSVIDNSFSEVFKDRAADFSAISEWESSGQGIFVTNFERASDFSTASDIISSGVIVISTGVEFICVASIETETELELNRSISIDAEATIGSLGILPFGHIRSDKIVARPWTGTKASNPRVVKIE